MNTTRDTEISLHPWRPPGQRARRDPVRRGEFLFRAALVASPLSVILFMGSGILFSSIANPAWAPFYLRDLHGAFLALFGILLIGSFFGVLVSLAACFAAGWTLWPLFARDGALTKRAAVRYGTAAGAVIAVVEIAGAVVLLTNGQPVGGGLFGLAFFDQAGEPTALTFIKLATDCIATIGLGALVGRLAWR